MKQSKFMSLFESFINTAIGYLVAIASQLVVFPLVGIHVPLKTNLVIGFWFTIISIIRGYFVRRFFNWSQENSKKLDKTDGFNEATEDKDIEATINKLRKELKDCEELSQFRLEGEANYRKEAYKLKEEVERLKSKLTYPDSLSANEYQRLVEWMKNPNRKPANIAFTASACRDAARAFEEFVPEIRRIRDELKSGGKD